MAFLPLPEKKPSVAAGGGSGSVRSVAAPSLCSALASWAADNWKRFPEPLTNPPVSGGAASSASSHQPPSDGGRAEPCSLGEQEGDVLLRAKAFALKRSNMKSGASSSVVCAGFPASLRAGQWLERVAPGALIGRLPGYGV